MMSRKHKRLDASIGAGLLVGACMSGDIDEAKKIIDAGANINFVYKDCLTPLVASIMKNNYDIVKLLLESGADPNLKVSYENKKITTFHMALIGYKKVDVSIDIIKLMLKHYANPHSEDDFTPVHYACLKEDLNLLKLLVSYGGKIELFTLSYILENEIKDISRYVVNNIGVLDITKKELITLADHDLWDFVKINDVEYKIFDSKNTICTIKDTDVETIKLIVSATNDKLLMQKFRNKLVEDDDLSKN